MTTVTTIPEAVAAEVYNAVACLWSTATLVPHKPAEEWVDYARSIQAKEGSARVVVLVYEAAMARHGSR